MRGRAWSFIASGSAAGDPSFNRGSCTLVITSPILVHTDQYGRNFADFQASGYASSVPIVTGARAARGMPI
jgi:hypothetical protein